MPPHSRPTTPSPPAPPAPPPPPPPEYRRASRGRPLTPSPSLLVSSDESLRREVRRQARQQEAPCRRGCHHQGVEEVNPIKFENENDAAASDPHARQLHCEGWAC